MKIIFSNCPWWEVDVDEASKMAKLRQGIRAGSRWPFTNQASFFPDQFRFGSYIPYPMFMNFAAGYTKGLFPTWDVSVRDSVARGESYDTYFKGIKYENPDYIVIETATSSLEHDLRIVQRLNSVVPGCKIILAGMLAAKDSPPILESYPNVWAICEGEYDKQIAKALVPVRMGFIPFDKLSEVEMNAAPFPIHDEQAIFNYFDACPEGTKAPQLQLWSSRGCTFRCLSGDTPVNTIEGMIPIKDLEGLEGIGVFTYDPIERRAKIFTAQNIRKYGTEDKLVRVKFDDGSHIDCTPDHKFLAFKWGNQHTGEKEWVVDAKDLKAGMHLRAIKTTMSGPARSQYLSAAWSRSGREKVHRMVAEWKLGRRLTSDEQVHHKDHYRLNNHPDNLEVCADHKEHFAKHPEIAQRMRNNNPTKGGMTPEWIAKLRTANVGKVRTPEARERYRKAAIIREAKKRGETIFDFNHRVISVEELPGIHDTYCLTIPETGWFYANNVLVKNCCFCSWPAVMTNQDSDGTGLRSFRRYTPEYVAAYLDKMLERYPFKTVYFDDDTFNSGDKHVLGICEVMAKRKLHWSAMCRADMIKRETWQAMKDSGCFGVKIGFETGSQRVIDEIIGKKLNLQKAADTAIWLRSIGIAVHGTFTIGLPGETEDEVKITKDFIESLYQQGGLDTHQLSGTAVIHGTPMEKIAQGEHLNRYNGAKVDENFVVAKDGVKKAEEMRN